MSWRSWMFSRFGVPLVAAAYVLATRWGKQNMLFYIALPAFFALYRVYLVQKDDPKTRRRFKRHPDYKPFRRAYVAWQVLEALNLMLLMLFEAIIAGIAESRPKIVLPYAIAIAGLFLPYTLLTVLSRRVLQRAYRIARDADAINVA